MSSIPTGTSTSSESKPSDELATDLFPEKVNI